MNIGNPQEFALYVENMTAKNTCSSGQVVGSVEHEKVYMEHEKDYVQCLSIIYKFH